MLKPWWESLSEREHKQAIAAGCVLLVGLFYWLVWSPLANAVSSNEVMLEKQTSLNSWAKDAIVQIKAAGGSANRNSASLSQIINQTSRRYNVSIGRMNPKGEQLNLVIEEIVFNDLLNWLAHLEQKQGVKIHNIDISNTDVAGLVRVSKLTIEKN